MTSLVDDKPVVVDPNKVVDPPVVDPNKDANKDAAGTLFPDKDKKVDDPSKSDKPADKDAKAIDDKAKEAEEKKTADEKAAADKKAAKAKEYTLKAPEGTELKPEAVTEFTALAKENGLNEAQAQKLVDWYAQRSKVATEEATKVWQTTNDGWVATAKADKEFGGEKFEASITSAKGAIAKFGNDEFKKALSLTGMGNHPEMIRFLTKISKAFGEDKMIDGKPLGGNETDVAKRLFPNQN